MKYLFFTLFLALAMFSCTPDDIAKPVDTPQKVDVREMVANSPAFAKFLAAKPAKGWDDDSFALALEDFDAEYYSEVEAIISRLPIGSTIEFIPGDTQPLLFNTPMKAVGPCSQAHQIEIEHAAGGFGICIAENPGTGAFGCVANYVNERIKADRQYDLCLSTTYPNANTGG